MREQLPGAAAPVRGPYSGSGYYRIRTHVDEAYGAARERWYANGAKVIPGDFEPTPASMLAAYLGDGSYRSGRSGRCVRLATCAFAVDQIGGLVAKLVSLGFAATINRLRAPYHEVVIRSRSVDDFLGWIGPCPLPAYAHKYGIRQKP